MVLPSQKKRTNQNQQHNGGVHSRSKQPQQHYFKHQRRPDVLPTKVVPGSSNHRKDKLRASALINAKRQPVGASSPETYEKRQEISAILKYLVFALNFIFFVCGLVCIGLGIYLHASDFRPIMEALDFFVNPNILLIIAGCFIFIISFLGCTGSLRENICMLKSFGLSLFLAYISLVILAFVIFILFYSNADTGISIQSLLLSAVRKYRDNKNMEYLMDMLQIALECCGATISQGYKDWDQSPFFNCSATLSPDRCGVPYSCCKSHQRIASCGFHAQEKAVTLLQESINTEGCVAKLQKTFEGYAVIVGAVIGAIIVPVCLSITLSNILASQIDRQRYILHKQARREERWQRRLRRKFRDPLAPLPEQPDSGIGGVSSAGPSAPCVVHRLDETLLAPTVLANHVNVVAPFSVSQQPPQLNGNTDALRKADVIHGQTVSAHCNQNGTFDVAPSAVNNVGYNSGGKMTSQPDSAASSATNNDCFNDANAIAQPVSSHRHNNPHKPRGKEKSRQKRSARLVRSSSLDSNLDLAKQSRRKHSEPARPSGVALENTAAARRTKRSDGRTRQLHGSSQDILSDRELLLASLRSNADAAPPMNQSQAPLPSHPKSSTDKHSSSVVSIRPPPSNGHRQQSAAGRPRRRRDSSDLLSMAAETAKNTVVVNNFENESRADAKWTKPGSRHSVIGQHPLPLMHNDNGNAHDFANILNFANAPIHPAVRSSAVANGAANSGVALDSGVSSRVPKKLSDSSLRSTELLLAVNPQEENTINELKDTMNSRNSTNRRRINL